MGAQLIRKAFQTNREQPVVVSLPGSVTAAVRKSWNVLGCLSLACPQVMDLSGKAKTKTEIREITHLHHALDACVLGLSSHFIPNNGRVWELIVKRRLTDSEAKELLKLEMFARDSESRVQLRDLADELKEQIRNRLAEKRVVQHVPSRMYGLRVEQNVWRVIAVKGGEAVIQQRIRQPDGSRPAKRAEEKTGKLLGVNPPNAGKLAAIKGALVIPDNYGVALDPEPGIVPFHKVWTRLRELKERNGDKSVRVIRNGQLIEVAQGKYKGIWKVFSAKNNASGMALDIGHPDVVRLKNKTEGHKINVLLASLLTGGLRVIRTPLTGVAVCPPATLSA